MSKIPQGFYDNFNTLVRAAKNGDLRLLLCKDNKTGVPVITIVAQEEAAPNVMQIFPLAKMFNGNPYEEISPIKEGVTEIIQQVPKKAKSKFERIQLD
jgi:hypothetical protein